MSPFVVECISGRAFFYGIALAMTGCIVCHASTRRVWGSPSIVLAAFGALLVGISSTPLPWILYALWAALLVLTMAGSTLCTARILPRHAKPWIFKAVFAGFSVLMVALELPYHFAPRIPVPEKGTLCVVGDSLSMGADAPDGNWPELLAEDLGLTCVNRSFGGAKVGSAAHNARALPEGAELVILEIGGNDVLFGTPPSDFAQDFEGLLQIASAKSGNVAVFELPLPPFCNAYGATQRRLVAEYGAHLIPKGVLAGVLGTPGATTDGLHLSSKGHRVLAGRVREMVVRADQKQPE